MLIVFIASKTHLPESLPVTLFLVVLAHLIFSRICIGSQLISALNLNCHFDVQDSELLLTCLSSFSTQLSHSHTFSAFCQHTSAVGSTCPRHLCLPRSSRGFSVAAPTVWNSLPFNICSSTIADTFRRLLKTHCFQQAYCSP